MMTRKTLGDRCLLATLAAVWLAMVGAGAARAAVLYSSPADYTKNSFQSTAATGSEQECTPFSIAGTSTITQISFWGDYFDNAPPNTDSFVFSLYAGGTPPGTTALTTRSTSSFTRTDTGLTGVRGVEVYFYTATLAAPFTVAGGTNYAIAVLNALPSWDWQLGAAGANFYRVGADGTAWTTSTNASQDAIQLIGTAVPEPSSVALLSVAALGAGAAWRRRRARA